MTNSSMSRGYNNNSTLTSIQMKGGTGNKFIFVAENMESQTKSNFHKSFKSAKSKKS
jgi:hypothetical protein